MNNKDCDEVIRLINEATMLTHLSPTQAEWIIPNYKINELKDKVRALVKPKKR